ncbi:MAG TPA: hypothetical protein VHI13_19420 [Candidatus Kapabacteria bacterium]|nr:hypothetical protein [Candidatus Kapabacteria bacterium]
MPLVDTTGGGSDTLYDRHDSTFIVATIFSPNTADTDRYSRYLVVTNMRCWPYDEKHYSSYVSSFHTTDTVGLGAIDARRPVVILKNSTGIIADSVRVQRIGDTTVRTVAYGAPVPLEWLPPGWGYMYKMTPVIVGVSKNGTAHNNAVHTENPSNDLRQRVRLVVTQRDSTIWLRAVDTLGTLSKEWMISDAADTVMAASSGGKRKRVANNFSPAIAVIRNDSSAAGHSASGLSSMILWERRDTNNKGSVEMLYLDSLPTRTGGMPGDATRHRLAPARTFLKSWMQLAPAVVGVEKTFVAAWGAPDGNGIEVIAINDPPSPGQASIDHRDTSHTLHVKYRDPLTGWPGDSAAQFPTLAYRRNYDSIRTSGATRYSPFEEDKGGNGESVLTDNAKEPYYNVHLAYQQGSRNNTSWQIMYNIIGVRDTLGYDANPLSPILLISATEHVLSNIGACQYTHPSIATDSALTGVAFEASNSTSSVVLRFRDTAQWSLLNWAPHWKTPFYRWGDLNLVQRVVVPWRALRAYANPSVTQYPGLRKNQLRGLPEGGIVWQWTNAPNNRRNRQVFYRYGDGGLDTTLSDGMDPTMMLTSNLHASRLVAFQSSSILHRGKDSLAFTHARPWGDSAIYYPAFIINTPAVPAAPFQQGATSGTVIVGTYTIISRPDAQWSPCTVPVASIRTGIVLPRVPVTRKRFDDTVYHDPALPVPPPPPFTDWPLPPTFFPAGPAAPSGTATLGDAVQIARTGDFHAGSSALSIRRIFDWGGQSRGMAEHAAVRHGGGQAGEHLHECTDCALPWRLRALDGRYHLGTRSGG